MTKRFGLEDEYPPPPALGIIGQLTDNGGLPPVKREINLVLRIGSLELELRFTLR